MTDLGPDRDELVRLREQHPHFDLDLDTADGLIDGHISADDAPPAYAPVVRVLAAANGPALAAEFEGEDAIRAMFVRERGEVVPLVLSSVDRRRSTRRVSRTVAGIALAGGLVLTGGAAAAATGNLPDAAQRIAHDILAPIGISIPDAPSLPDAVPSTEANGRPGQKDGQGGQGDGTPPDENSGQAPAPGTDPADASAGADNQGNGQAHDPASDNGQASDNGKANAPGQAPSPGPEQSPAPEANPGNGNANGKDTAPGQADGTGKDTAPGQANGTGKDTAPGQANGTGKDTAPGQANGTTG